MDTEKKGHGGARPGAGRKTMGNVKKVPLNLKILPEAKDKLIRLAKKKNKPQAQVLEEIIFRQK